VESQQSEIESDANLSQFEECKSEEALEDTSESSDEEREDRELMQALKHMVRLGVEEAVLGLLEKEPELKHISE
jgi:hypothetical protein